MKGPNKKTVIVEPISPPIFVGHERMFFVHWYDEDFHDRVHLRRGQGFCRYPFEKYNIIHVSGPSELEKAFEQARWPKPPCDGKHREWRCPAIAALKEKPNVQEAH